MIGKLGHDIDGDNFVNQFCSLNINTEFLTRTKKAATGIATIIVDELGNNAIVIVTGANMCLEPDDVIAAKSIIQKSKIVVCQNEISLTTTLEALKTAKFYGKFTIFNPAPAPLQDLKEEFYQCSDIICCNETETLALTGISVKTIDSAKTAAFELVQKGASIAIITMGENGCVFMENSSSKPIHIVAPQTKAIDTTGAGDCFVGALAFLMASFPSLSLSNKIERACKIASKSVCKEGTQSSFPSQSDLCPSLFSAS